MRRNDFTLLVFQLNDVVARNGIICHGLRNRYRNTVIRAACRHNSIGSKHRTGRGLTAVFTIAEYAFFRFVYINNPRLADSFFRNQIHFVHEHFPFGDFQKQALRKAEYRGIQIITTADADVPDGANRSAQRGEPFLIYGNKKAILLVVTNPVDVLTYVTLARSGYPASRVIGSGTVLDTARLKQLIGQSFEVDSRNVHSFIIGEHGDSELPVFSSANISGVDIEKYCDISGKKMGVLDSVYDDVKNSAYRIIEAKGATYYAIAESVLRICRALVRDENTIMPVSVLANGEYGIKDVCIGLPSIIGYGGVKRVLEIPLDRAERALLKKSADALKDVIERLDESEIMI